MNLLRDAIKELDHAVMYDMPDANGNPLYLDEYLEHIFLPKWKGILDQVDEEQ